MKEGINHLNNPFFFLFQYHLLQLCLINRQHHGARGAAVLWVEIDGMQSVVGEQCAP